jgi:hypothetical protein
LVGVGKSDGEGVKWTWADLNPAAFHTKEMGAGNRADTLEDKIDSHNFLKNLTHGISLSTSYLKYLLSTVGDALRRKLLVAIGERQRQVDAFKEVNRTVLKNLWTAWQADIDAFVKDHTQHNPYVLPNSGTEREIQCCTIKWLILSRCSDRGGDVFGAETGGRGGGAAGSGPASRD